MSFELTQVHLPQELQHALHQLARERDITPGQVIRDLVAREISRSSQARPPIRADERLVAPLRARLAEDLAYATDWNDLDTRLRAKGYVLRAAGGGLALRRWPEDTRLCKASELGFSYSKLMHRFGTPFPGHPHAWLARRLIDPRNDTAPSPDGDGAEDDFDVIERF